MSSLGYIAPQEGDLIEFTAHGVEFRNWLEFGFIPNKVYLVMEFGGLRSLEVKDEEGDRRVFAIHPDGWESGIRFEIVNNMEND